MTTPDLKLRRLIWDDGGTSIDPEDYEVVDARGERVGRMYRTIYSATIWVRTAAIRV
jgi:hypothetical protein